MILPTGNGVKMPPQQKEKNTKQLAIKSMPAGFVLE
jgi:hypothetical protein